MTKTILAIAFLVLCLATQIRADDKILPPAITVSSTGEVKVPPTEAVVSITIEQRNTSVQALHQQTDSTVAKIITYLESQQISSQDIQTTHIAITPFYTQLSDGAGSTIVDYYMGQKSMTFVLKQLNNYDTVMTGLYNLGLNRVDSITYRVTNDWENKLEAKKRAVENAKEVATTIANTLEVSLGNVYSVSDYSYSEPVFIPGAIAADLNASSGPSVAGGQVTFSANVNAVFYIAQ